MTTERQIGAIEKVDIKEVWPTEDSHFTPWLGNNLDKLGEELDMDLELVETEAEVGPFKLDVLARDSSAEGDVVIENQYGDTDHSHLGKLLTYAGGFDAQAVVWIAERFRDEHRQALDFLNLRTGEDTQFFGVEIELWKIGNSYPAPHFKLVATPNDWRKQTVRSSQSAQLSERGERYLRFNAELIETLKTEHSFGGRRRPRPRGHCNFATGHRGVVWNAWFAADDKVGTTVHINSVDKTRNKKWFDALQEEKCAIEAAFGEPLEWERRDERRYSRIAVYREGSIDDDDDTLEEVHDWMVERLLKFSEVFGPRLDKLPK